MDFNEMRLESKQISYKLIFNNSKDRNQTEQIIAYNKFTDNIYKQTEPKRVGYSLMNFTNNFYRIQNTFIEFIHYIKNLEDFRFEDFDTYRTKLVTSLYAIIPEESDIMVTTIDTFLYDIKHDYYKMNFLKEIEKSNYKNEKNSENIHTYLSELEKYIYDNINTEHYDNVELCFNTSIHADYTNFNQIYQKMFISFLSKYQEQLEYLYFYVIETFSSKENKSINSKRFTGIPLNINNSITQYNNDNQHAICLPYSEAFFEIYHDNNNEPKPSLIRYYIRHFSDFVFSSLYNILQSKVAIGKCKYCERYFITCLDNKEHFCPTLDNFGNYKSINVLIETDDAERTDTKLKAVSNCEKLYKPKKRGRQQKFNDEELTELLRKHKKRLNREKKTQKGIEEQKTLAAIDSEIERRYNILKELYGTDTKIIEKELFDFASSIINSFEENCNNKKYGNKNALKNN